MNDKAAPSKSARILTAAINKTEEIQTELKQAAQTLNTTNALLAAPLTQDQSIVEVAAAVEEKNLAAEASVQDASRELEAVKDLIETAKSAESANANSGQGTASILAYFEGRRAQASDDERAAAEKKDKLQ